MAADDDEAALHWERGVSTVGVQLIASGHALVDVYMAFDVASYARLYRSTQVTSSTSRWLGCCCTTPRACWPRPARPITWIAPPGPGQEIISCRHERRWAGTDDRDDEYSYRTAIVDEGVES
jgi:hypothetical protein